MGSIWLCLNSFGMLNLLTLYCILFLLPYVVLTVLYVVACINPFWHCCFSPRSQTTAVSYSLHMALSSKHFFSGVAWCFCILCDSWGVQGWCLCPGYITWSSAEWCCWVFWRRWDCWSGWDQWHYARLVAHVQIPPQNRSCLQRLQWNVTVFTVVRSLRTDKWLVWSGHLAILVSIALLLLGHPWCSHTAAWPWETWKRLISDEKFSLQNLAFEGWSWGTNVFATVISGQRLMLLLWSVSRRRKG